MEKIIRVGLILFWVGTGAQDVIHAAQKIAEKKRDPQCLICSEVTLPVDIEDGDDEEEMPCGIALCHGIGKVEVFENWDTAIAAYKKKPTAHMHFLHVSCIQKILRFKNSCPGCGNHFSGKERQALLQARSVAASLQAPPAETAVAESKADKPT